MPTKQQRRLTKRDAEKVLALVREQFAAWITPTSGPTLVRGWEWGWYGSTVYPWAILWEEGPFEWTLLFPHGSHDLEFGTQIGNVADRMPVTVYAEPVNGWALALYPEG